MCIKDGTQGCRNYFLSRTSMQMPPSVRHRPTWRYELILAAPEVDDERFLGLLREAAGVVPSELVDRQTPGWRPGSQYRLFAVDKQASGRLFDLAGIPHRHEEAPVKAPAWLQW